MTKTTIKVRQDTRKKLKLYATEHGITMDEATNKLLQAQIRYNDAVYEPTAHQKKK